MADKILVVDDDQATSLSLKMRLKDNGFEIETAGNGFEALEKLNDFPANIVLMDVNMPLMDGVTALKHMVERFPGTDVIMMTGFADFTTALECLKQGAIDYLVKPIEVTELTVRIRTTLRAQNSEKQLHQVRNEYISKVVHDVLGPIKMVDDTISNILTGSAGTITKELALVLRQINDMTRKMSTRMGEFVDITALNASHFTLSLQSVNIAQLLQNIFLRHKILSTGKMLQFEKQLPKDDIYVQCDYDMIGWVVHTILDYAIKFSITGSKIEVHSKEAMMDDTKCIEISISDEGYGMQPEILSYIFSNEEKDFSKLTSADKETVFELMIAKYVIEAHHGTMWVNSQVGVQTTFSFKLPLHQESTKSENG